MPALRRYTRIDPKNRRSSDYWLNLRMVVSAWRTERSYNGNDLTRVLLITGTKVDLLCHPEDLNEA